MQCVKDLQDRRLGSLIVGLAKHFDEAVELFNHSFPVVVLDEQSLRDYAQRSDWLRVPDR